QPEPAANPEVRADPVDSHIIRIGALPVNAELSLLRELSGGSHHSWCQLNQRLETATVERHVFHKATINHRAHGGVLRINERRATRYGYALFNRAHLHLEVLRNRILNMENDALLHE